MLERGDLRSSEGGQKGFHGRLLLALLAFAFLLRLPLLLSPEVIHNDGTEYVRHAKEVLLGNWIAGKAPPLYPSLIALFQTLTRNHEMAGIWVSVILGTLLVLPVFSLGKAIFSERVGMIAALFAAVHPFFTISSGSVLTESTYYFLFATSVLFGWKAFEEGRFSNILLFGLFTSLAFLTRPEAIGFLCVFGLWVLFVPPSGTKRAWTKRAGIALLAVFAFLLFSSPYLIQMRKESGRWWISKKFSLSTDSAEEGGASIESFTRRKEINLNSLVHNPLTVLKKIGAGFLNSLYKFQQAFTPILFLLAILGFILNRDIAWKGSLYLMAYLLFFLGFVFPFFWVTRRYTSQMIPLALPWAALGFLGVTSWLSKWFKEGSFPKRFPAILLVLLLAGLFVQGRLIHSREHRFIQKEVGFWMKDHLPKGARVMSKEPQEAFYAELPWVRTPLESYEKIMEKARTKGVRYLVVDEGIEKDSPDFLEKSGKGELVPLFDLKRKTRRMIVFEIKEPQGK